MSNYDNPGSEVHSGLDSASGLPGSNLHPSHDLFGQPLSKTPTALHSDHPLLKPENYQQDGADQADPLTGLPKQNGTVGGHGYEFESGIAPIDYTVHLAGKALDAVDQVIESSTPVVKRVVTDAVAQISDSVHDSIDTAQKNWNAPDNEVRITLNNRLHQAIGFAKQKMSELSADPEVKEAVTAVTRLSRTVAEKTKNFVEMAQSATEGWVDQAFESSYVDKSLPTTSLSNDRSQSPFVGVIDTSFEPESHGSQVVDAIQQSGKCFPDWLGDGVGTGGWTDSLVQFVDAAKASGRAGALVNLSFDLTQINPDGSVSTRHELTAEEWAALSYAQDNNVLLVVSTGNQGSQMSALGKASQAFDNIIAVGAAQNGQRADYSSYGSGVDVVASGKGKGDVEGTSLSAAKVTGAIAQIWKANPELNYRQVVEALAEGAKDLQAPGFDPFTGHGELDADSSIEIAKTKGSRLDDLDKVSQSAGVDELSTDHLFSSNDNLELASERPAFLNQLEDAVSSGFDAVYEQFQDKVVEPIAERIPEPIKEPVRSVIDTVKETAAEIIDDPFNFPESLRDAASNISTAAEGLTYPGYVFQYEPGTTPSYDPKVEQWQARMQERGWNIAVDGYYGAHSAEVARQFQEEKGLTADGIVGSDTWAATFSTRNETHTASQTGSGILPDGASETGEQFSQSFRYEPEQSLTYNPDVEQWQERMRERGWNIEVDGYYGAQSAEVARQFQAEKGLVADGIVGPQTWEASFSTTNITAPSPEELAGSGPSISYGGIPSNATPDSHHPQYSGQMTENGALSSNMRAFLDTISYAEGTYAPDGYRIRFGGDRFDSFADHPRIHEPFRDTTSTAAGRYQFIQRTWDSVRSQIGLSDFSPQSQDLAAVQLIKNRGAYQDVEAGQFESAVAKVSKEWASFPGAGYNQPEKNLSDLKEFYEARLQQYQGGLTVASDASSLPTGDLLKYEAGQPLMQGESVKAWQEFLNEQGYSIDVDGAYGSESADATRQFQQSQGIAADGIVGKETIAAGKNEGFGITSHSKTIGDPNLQDSSQEELIAHNIDDHRGIAPSINNPFGTEIGPVPPRTEISSPPSGTIFGFIKDRDGGSEPVYLQRYGSEGPVEQEIESNKETVVVIHGWNPDLDIPLTGGTARKKINELAKEAASNSNLQVLTLDWGALANTNGGLSAAAERIAPVARWAQDHLVELGIKPEQLTLIGHSFGSYVSAEIARTFDEENHGKVKNVVALDPAAGSFNIHGMTIRQLPGYEDIDREREGEQLPPNFRDVATNSLSFVSADDELGGGDGGDNGRAATAHNSFLVDYDSSLVEPNTISAHNSVIDVFTDALDQGLLELPNLTLPYQLDDWYGHDGDKKLSWFNPFGSPHEGKITVVPGEDGQNPRRITEWARVVDSSGREEKDLDF